MDFLVESFSEAIGLIFSFDREIAAIVLLTLTISLTALAAAVLVGVPLGTVIGLSSFRGRSAIVTLSSTLMAVPTVVIGLLLYGLLSRQGPLGPFDLLYTPFAVWLGQFLLVIPLIVSFTIAAIESADRRIFPTALTLGATRTRAAMKILCENRAALISAIAAGYGRVISEVGCALMVGGNIKDHTRIMTTAITAETRRGEFASALALGIILLAIALAVNIVILRLMRRPERSFHFAG